MRTSEQINELATALASAQLEIEGAKKDASNPFYKSAYADMQSVTEALKPLHKFGLSYTQGTFLNTNTNTYELYTRLMHKSGQWLECSYPIICKDQSDPQKLGSAVTYARRYSLQSITGLSAIDDDGNNANNIKTELLNKPQQPPVQKQVKNMAPQTQPQVAVNQQNKTQYSDMLKNKQV